jgi:hypothetical protein
MTTHAQTCTERVRGGSESCGGEIRQSYSAPAPIVGAQAQKGDITHPAACQTCGKTYVDVISIGMTHEEMDMVGDRISPHARQELRATATGRPPRIYEVELTEDRARDFASKAANLGLVAIADKIRQELNGLTIQRRQRVHPSN